MKRKLKLSNIWQHGKSTFLACLIAAFTYALVWPLKVATFDQVSPLLLVVIPLLLAGKKQKEAEDE